MNWRHCVVGLDAVAELTETVVTPAERRAAYDGARVRIPNGDRSNARGEALDWHWDCAVRSTAVAEFTIIVITPAERGAVDDGTGVTSPRRNGSTAGREPLNLNGD